MLFYIGLLAVITLAGIPACRNRTGKIIYCAGAGVVLFIVAALRRSVGFDYNNYAWIYYNYMSFTPEEIAETRIEKGYGMIVKLLADYIPDYQTIFVIMAFFFAAAATLAIYKYCEKPYLGFFFFMTFGVYFNTMNFLRQMTAGFIVFYAFRFIKKNQFFRYLIIVIFASCFHLSALFMIPFYFILRIKMTPVSLGVYSVITAVGMIFSWEILDFITDYVYRSYQPRTNEHVLVGVDPTYMIFFGVFFILAFLMRKRLAEKDQSADIWINCMLFVFIFELIGVKHSIVSRLGVYFIIPAAIVLMPKLLKSVTAYARSKIKAGGEDRKKKLTVCTAVTAGVFISVCVGMYGLMIARNYNGVVPYHTVYHDFGTGGAE